MFPKALKSCPKSKKLPNLVTLVTALQCAHVRPRRTQKTTVMHALRISPVQKPTLTLFVVSCSKHCRAHSFYYFFCYCSFFLSFSFYHCLISLLIIIPLITNLYSFLFSHTSVLFPIGAVNQGNLSLSIKLRLECFVSVK